MFITSFDTVRLWMFLLTLINRICFSIMLWQFKKNDAWWIKKSKIQQKRSNFDGQREKIYIIWNIFFLLTSKICIFIFSMRCKKICQQQTLSIIYFLTKKTILFFPFLPFKETVGKDFLTMNLSLGSKIKAFLL